MPLKISIFFLTLPKFDGVYVADNVDFVVYFVNYVVCFVGVVDFVDVVEAAETIDVEVFHIELFRGCFRQDLLNLNRDFSFIDNHF